MSNLQDGITQIPSIEKAHEAQTNAAASGITPIDLPASPEPSVAAPVSSNEGA